MLTALPSLQRSRARVVALFAVLLAFDVAFVAAVYVLAHVALGLIPLLNFDFGGLFWTMGFDYVPLWQVLVVGTPLTLAVQSVFGYRLTLRDVAGGDGSEMKNLLLADRSPDDGSEATVVAAPSLVERVERLAQTADVAPPSVEVVDSETPNSYVASRPGERTLFVTTGLLARLSDAELDAVLAHELAHLKNGDAFVMTAGAFLPAVSGRFLGWLARALRLSMVVSFVWDLDDEDTGSVPQAEIPLLLFTAVAAPVAGLLYLASTACYRLLSRIREYAADAGGVAIAGSPAALSSALETLTTDGRPGEDLRTAETGVRELCVLPYAIEDDDERHDDGLGRLRERWKRRCESVLPGSHPEPDERIAALRDRQADLERQQ